MEIIKEDVFRKQLKKGLSGGYLFFGEEDYMKSFCLRLARETICTEETFAVFNDVRLSPLDYTEASLVNALMPPPMMSEQKIVTIDGLVIDGMRADELEGLCDALSVLSEYDYNVLIISVPNGGIDLGTSKKPSAALTELSKHLTPVQFDSVSGARLTAWVGKHFEHHGVSASPAICNMLIDRCGKSMFTLSSEAEKVSYYVLAHGRSEVSAEDIENVSASIIEADAFALSNAITDGKYAEAIDALRVLKFHRIDSVIILSEVSRTVSDLLCIKLMQAEGASITDMARALKHASDYKTKLYARAAANKSVDKLRRAVLLCSEADATIKESTQDYGPIERLICHL